MENTKDTKDLVAEYAIENFRNGLNCAESVYDALLRSGALNAPKETVAMCIGFGGGIGLSGNACGALTAAVMANGAVHGRTDPWSVDKEQRGKEISDKYYRRYNKLCHDFNALAGGVTCRDICSPFEDWHSRERAKNCMKLIAATAVMAYEYLNMSQEEAFALRYGENIGGRND